MCLFPRSLFEFAKNEIGFKKSEFIFLVKMLGYASLC